MIFKINFYGIGSCYIRRKFCYSSHKKGVSLLVGEGAEAFPGHCQE